MKDLNTVHLNGLRAVEAVGRLGSLQAAAAELGVTIGAVSQQIVKTEKQLGRVLFERSPRGLVATPFGESILPRLTGGFETLDQAVALARRRDETILTISVAPVFAARWLVHRLDHFTEKHPDIRLRIDATTALVNLESAGVDVGIRVGAGNWPDVKSELLLEQEVFPVCSPAMAENLKEPKDILGLPAVIDGRSMFSWETWLREVGLSGETMTARHVFNEASLCLDAAIAGQGVMLAWQTLAGYSIIEGRLVMPYPIRVKTGFAHYFVTPPSRRESKTVSAFKQWVRAEIAESMRRLGFA
ncbi:LysR family transcriptional regulator [Pararhizobium polonicum]|uniref:LysR family transcriptional regulator n=1 Tax=Pararhizobium polonicum TaxID=1612624 RepID=A0A1C7P3S7_9HYPH|nr:LysR substrate-binding domain-containing protein [Pararhizobium polonicum]OBZ95932.1 LysR family transcriptional regulator [Pararhizobium polonicum]